MSDSHDQDKNSDYEAEGGSVVDVHDSVRREKVLPPTGGEPVTLGLLITTFLILVLGAGYLGANGNFFGGDIYVSSYYQPDPRPAGKGGAGSDEDLPWIDQWMADGKKVYGSCATCHLPGGTGLPGAFPPLKDSEWVNGGTARIAAIVLHGVNGSFTVDGQAYNGLMQPWGLLSDEQIAQVITYVRREFGALPEGEDGIVTAEMIAAARERFKGQTTFWDEAGLRAIPEGDMLPGAKVDPQTGEPAGSGGDAAEEKEAAQ